MSEEGEQILYNYLDTFKNLKRVRIFQKANYYNWRWCHATRWETRNITIDRETRSEYSSRIDRESSRDRARGRTEEVDGQRRQTESKREEEENFQFCSTAGLPSGNFETNWLSRESSTQTDERWFRRSARWIQKHPGRGPAEKGKKERVKEGGEFLAAVPTRSMLVPRNSLLT